MHFSGFPIKPLDTKRPIWISILVSFLGIGLLSIFYFFMANPSARCKLSHGEWMITRELYEFMEEYPAVAFDPDYAAILASRMENGFCNHIHPDGGKPCQSNNECQGKCVFVYPGDDYGACTEDTLMDMIFH